MVLKVFLKFPLHWYWSMDGSSQFWEFQLGGPVALLLVGESQRQGSFIPFRCHQGHLSTPWVSVYWLLLLDFLSTVI